MTKHNRNETSEQELSALLTKLGDDGVELLTKVLRAKDAAGTAGHRVVADVKGDDGVGDSGSLGSSASDSVSWADEAQAEADLHQSTVYGIPVISDSVRMSVSFGGFGLGVPNEDGSGIKGPSDKGLMGQYVRTTAAKEMRRILGTVGIRMPKQSAYHIALITHSLATVPGFFVGGSDKLRVLAMIGEGWLMTDIAAVGLMDGATPKAVNDARQRVMNKASLAKSFARTRMANVLSYSAGASGELPAVGSNALFAIVGLVAVWRDPGEVRKLVRYFDLAY